MLEVGSTGELDSKVGAVLYAKVTAPRPSSVVRGTFLELVKRLKPTEVVAEVEGPATLSISASPGSVDKGSDEFVGLGPPVATCIPEVPSSTQRFPPFGGGVENHPASGLSTFSECFLFLVLPASTTYGYNQR